MLLFPESPTGIVRFRQDVIRRCGCVSERPKGRIGGVYFFLISALLILFYAVVPDKQKQQLENVLTEEEYESLFDWKRSDFRIGWESFNEFRSVPFA